MIFDEQENYEKFGKSNYIKKDISNLSSFSSTVELENFTDNSFQKLSNQTKFDQTSYFTMQQLLSIEALDAPFKPSHLEYLFSITDSLDRQMADLSAKLIIKIIRSNPKYQEEISETAMNHFINSFSMPYSIFMGDLLIAEIENTCICNKLVCNGVLDQLRIHFTPPSINKDGFIYFTDIQIEYIGKTMSLINSILEKMSSDYTISEAIYSDVLPYITNEIESLYPDLFYQALDFSNSLISKKSNFWSIESLKHLYDILINIVLESERKEYIFDFFLRICNTKYLDSLINFGVLSFIFTKLPYIEKDVKVLNRTINIIRITLYTKPEIIDDVMGCGLCDSVKFLIENGSISERLDSAKFFSLLCKNPYWEKSADYIIGNEIVVQIGELFTTISKENDFDLLLDGMFTLTSRLIMRNEWNMESKLAVQFASEPFLELIDEKIAEDITNPSLKLGFQMLCDRISRLIEGTR